MADDLDIRIRQLGELYHRDRQQFEEERSRLIHETIEGFNAEHRRQAYGLQFRIDCMLRPYRDPVMRMNKMVEIFWKGVCDFQEVLNNPGGKTQARQAKRPCKILPLRAEAAIKPR